MNDTIFSDIYYGNIDFTDKIALDPKYRKELQKLDKIDDTIHKVIPKSTSKLFDDYINQSLKLQSMEHLEAFKQGFIFALRLFKEIP